VHLQPPPWVVLALGLCLHAAPVLAQQSPPPPEEPAQPPASDVPAREKPPETITVTPTEPTPGPVTAQPDSDQASRPEVQGVFLDGHVRQGAFLSGPGSFTFIMHHSLLGAAAGLVTQGISEGFQVDQFGTREAMLAGTLIGAGIGFGISAWWQFHHWIGAPMAQFAIINSIASGLFFTAFSDLFSDSPLALSWAGFLGAELGAWLTASIGGGDMPLNHGLLIASGAGWGLIYSALLLGILTSSGSSLTTEGKLDTLGLSTGIGAGVMAIATTQFNPTTLQIARADLFGVGVGGAVFVLSALVLGFKFDVATPYVLAAVSSAGAIAAVSFLWEESAEPQPAQGNAAYFYRSKEKDRPYSLVWW
jgi:hypothetical protein